MSQNVIATHIVNQLVRHLDAGGFTVKRIKELGISPAFESSNAVYWDPNTPQLIEEKLNAPKPKRKSSDQSQLDRALRELQGVAEGLGRDMSIMQQQMDQINKTLDALLEIWK